MRTRRLRPAAVVRSAFAGFRFPPEVVVLAVRWYLRFALSYRDVEELLVERGIAVDQAGQVIGGFVSPRRDRVAAGGFFGRTIATTGAEPVEVVTDRAATYPIGREELLPAAWHRTDRYANNGVEADHGRLKAQLRPMCGLKQDRSAWVVIGGHALVHNLRRGH